MALGARLEEAADAELPEEVSAALRRLSRHYIPPRYPDAHPGGSTLAHYGSDDAEEAIFDADLVIAHVDALWTKLLEAQERETEQEENGR